MVDHAPSLEDISSLKGKDARNVSYHHGCDNEHQHLDGERPNVVKDVS